MDWLYIGFISMIMLIPIVCIILVSRGGPKVHWWLVGSGPVEFKEEFDVDIIEESEDWHSMYCKASDLSTRTGNGKQIGQGPEFGVVVNKSGEHLVLLFSSFWNFLDEFNDRGGKAKVDCWACDHTGKDNEKPVGGQVFEGTSFGPFTRVRTPYGIEGICSSCKDKVYRKVIHSSSDVVPEDPEVVAKQI